MPPRCDDEETLYEQRPMCVWLRRVPTWSVRRRIKGEVIRECEEHRAASKGKRVKVEKSIQGCRRRQEQTTRERTRCATCNARRAVQNETDMCRWTTSGKRKRRVEPETKMASRRATARAKQYGATS